MLSWVIKKRLSGLHDLIIKKHLPSFILDSGVLFVHIPKVAGISICDTLYGKEIGHRRLRDYWNINRSETNDLFKFSFVRSPETRLLSAYNYLASGGMKKYGNDKKVGDFLKRRYPTFDDFVLYFLNERNIYSYVHFIPQFEFLVGHEGNIDIDFVGKFENIVKDFEKIAKQVRMSGNLEIQNSSPNSNANFILSDKIKDRIRFLYSRDYDLFGY